MGKSSASALSAQIAPKFGQKYGKKNFAATKWSSKIGQKSVQKYGMKIEKAKKNEKAKKAIQCLNKMVTDLARKNETKAKISEKFVELFEMQRKVSDFDELIRLNGEELKRFEVITISSIAELEGAGYLTDRFGWMGKVKLKFPQYEKRDAIIYARQIGLGRRLII